MQAQLSPMNPLLYDVSLEEFLEPFIGHPVRVKIAPSLEALETAPDLYGKLALESGVPVLYEGKKAQKLDQPLAEYFTKKMCLEVLQVLPEDRDPAHGEEFEICFYNPPSL